MSKDKDWNLVAKIEQKIKEKYGEGFEVNTKIFSQSIEERNLSIQNANYIPSKLFKI